MDIKKFADKYGNAKIMRYRDLTRPYQLAIGYYMSIDGDVWDFVNDNWRNHRFWYKENPSNKDREEFDRYVFRVMVRSIPLFIKEYGGNKFGVGEFPTEILIKRIIDCGWPSAEINTIESYKDWVKKNTGIPGHPKRNRWPVILDSYDDSYDNEANNFLQDGFHRMHCYLLRGDKTIPFVYYA
jgi:hypothetical protein